MRRALLVLAHTYYVLLCAVHAGPREGGDHHLDGALQYQRRCRLSFRSAFLLVSGMQCYVSRNYMCHIESSGQQAGGNMGGMGGIWVIVYRIDA